MSEVPGRAGEDTMEKQGTGPGEEWKRVGWKSVMAPAETEEKGGAVPSLGGRWQQD